MKKLVVFGDSYLTTDMRVKPAQSIPEIISKKFIATKAQRLKEIELCDFVATFVFSCLSFLFI